MAKHPKSPSYRNLCSQLVRCLICASVLSVLYSCDTEEVVSNQSEEEARPCPGDPVLYPMLAPQKVSSFNGAKFGMVRNGGKRMHKGIDLRMQKGTKLHAMYDSYIYEVSRGQDWGKYVVCLTTYRGEQLLIMYAHVRQSRVKAGEFVRAGDVIAISGDTGNLKEAEEQGYVDLHLHLEVRQFEPGKTFYQSEALDPEEYMSTKLGYNGRPKKERPCHQR